MKAAKQRKILQIFINNKERRFSETELTEVAVIEAYLPQQLSDEELMLNWRNNCWSWSCRSCDMGKVMGKALVPWNRLMVKESLQLKDYSIINEYFRCNHSVLYLEHIKGFKKGSYGACYVLALGLALVASFYLWILGDIWSLIWGNIRCRFFIRPDIYSSAYWCVLFRESAKAILDITFWNTG